MYPSRSDAPKGRGALIATLLREKQEKLEAASSSGTVTPRGRAALLMSFKNKESAVGAASSSSAQAAPALAMGPDISGMDIKDEPLLYMGESGRTVPGTTNYISLKVMPNRGVFEYEVRFNPDVDSLNVRSKLVKQALAGRCKPGNFTGTVLYMPQKLFEPPSMTFSVEHPFSKETIAITFIFKKKQRLGECMHLYNILFKRIMYALQYVRIGRHFFDNKRVHSVPQHKLEVWPGYVTAVNEYEGGVMLCLDVQHRVLRTQNALEFIMDAYQQNRANYRNYVQNIIIGSSVLTRYNNKSYIVHDVVWKASPRSTFQMKSGKLVSYMDYYSTQYGIEIRNMEQPLLMSRQSVNVANQLVKEDRFIMLIPELCYLSGLTDEMRSDFRMMKAIAEFTRITPSQRMLALRKYISAVNECSEAKEILSEWGLVLDSGTTDLQMRILEPEVLLFGNDIRVQSTEGADWSSATVKNNVLQPVDFHNWLLICTQRDRRQVEEFLACMIRIGPRIGIDIAQPELYILPDDRNETYTSVLMKKISPDLQLVCVVCPTCRDDRYAAIKKICCVKNPIASQVINSKTIRNPSRLTSVAQKIVLQINCKLGGWLWTVRFPFKKWMVCGIDVHHTSRLSSRTVCGLVCSMNEAITRWFSTCSFNANDREISEHLKPLFTKALLEYRESNSVFPTSVVVYRDGVSDGDMNTVKQYEVTQFLDAARDLGISIKLLYIIVQKRINTRLFLKNNQEYENSPPGSIMDHTVSKRNFYDFFLVAQQVRQGTVTPTHYTVLYDSVNLKPDNVQRLTFKLCHMYFNWTGTIRVPAPCQYAHKLALLIGQNVSAEQAPALSKNLFYL